MTDEKPAFEGWAILELMGHRRLGGHVSEATVAGAGFLRIDVPDASTVSTTPTSVAPCRMCYGNSTDPVCSCHGPAA